ncbi:transposon Tf2-6 polyprotein [Nephila pilipes]|uniref:Transposon Tf2-6 polyprotein n=1 Tax=Nephila pilipes TaxID=299642 RepID=A0A8X6MC91_NEPPI|nr:transposon Tf2-6 polyprotein [Nephila pilipes]
MKSDIRDRVCTCVEGQRAKIFQHTKAPIGTFAEPDARLIISHTPRFHSTSSHFCIDKVRPPLTPSYSGPHMIKNRSDKNFVIDLKGKSITVTIDRLKAVYEFSEEIPLRVTPKAIQKFSLAEKLLQNEKTLSKNVRKTI